MNEPYRLIEHTADFGLHVFGASAPELYAHAAMAMIEQIVDLTALCGEQTSALFIRGSDAADLMVNWLRELLYFWTGKARLVQAVQVRRVTGEQLEATVTWAAFDPVRHEIKTEIKAVTYHRIQVEKTPGGWEAKIIFDV